MPPITRAISIRQPFVEQILRGTKKAEYRSRLTNIRERVYIYASLRPADHPGGWTQLGRRPGSLRTGAIVGTVEIVGCKWDSKGERYAYVLRNPRRLRTYLYPKNQPQPVFWKPKL